MLKLIKIYKYWKEKLSDTSFFSYIEKEKGLNDLEIALREIEEKKEINFQQNIPTIDKIKPWKMLIIKRDDILDYFIKIMKEEYKKNIDNEPLTKFKELEIIKEDQILSLILLSISKLTKEINIYEKNKIYIKVSSIFWEIHKNINWLIKDYIEILEKRKNIWL